MLQGLLHLTRPWLPDLSMRGIRFGPYLHLESVPWLLLATVFRARAKTTPDDLSALVYSAAGEFALFLAFLIASQRMIQLWGGSTSLDRLEFKEELRLAWSALWRLNLMYLLLTLFAIVMGMEKLNAVGFFFGFDGIVIKWHACWLPLWSAVVACLLFLFVVERGMDRKPKGYRVLLQFLRQIRYLLPVIIVLTVFYFLAGELQRLMADWIEPLYQMINTKIGGVLLVGFIFVFSYARLLITIYALTFAVRRFHLSAATAK